MKENKKRKQLKLYFSGSQTGVCQKLVSMNDSKRSVRWLADLKNK